MQQGRTWPAFCLCALCVYALVGLAAKMNAVPAHAELMETVASPAGINVISQSDVSLEVEFIDGSSQSVTVEFQRDDVNSPWLPVDTLQSGRGIGFGNESPRLPTLALLRNRQLSPATVVKPFQPDFYQGPIDDLTIYQLAGGQLAVAVHHDDMVVSVGYAGYLAHSIWIGTNPWVTVCTHLRNLCCDGVGSPPAPDIESCRNAIRYCGSSVAGQVCDCQLDWCEQDPPHGPSCNLWITCCFGSECDLPVEEDDTGNEQANDLMNSVIELLQYHLDSQ